MIPETVAAWALGPGDRGRYVVIPVSGRPPLTGRIWDIRTLPGAPIVLHLERAPRPGTRSITCHLLSPSDELELHP